VFIFLAVCVLLVIVIAVFVMPKKAKNNGDTNEEEWPFYARRPLSVPEQVLYFRLKEALPEHIVLAQVALSRMLGVKKGNNFWTWFNRINRMSADFVVCSKDSRIVAVIELDDSSHKRPYREEADEKKDRALNAAGIRIERWQVNALPDKAAIEAAFAYTRSSLSSNVLPLDRF
jgi:very-short-patch-repair endonuclease